MQWDRKSFGILLGLGISSCEHLATWSILTNANPSPHQRILIDFMNMATYHVCVIVWYYYLLVPEKEAARTRTTLGPALFFVRGTSERSRRSA